MTDDGSSATAPPAVRRRARRLALAAAAGLSAGFAAALLSGSAAQADPSSTPSRTLERVTSSAHDLVRTVPPTARQISSPRPPKASPALDSPAPDSPTVSAPTGHSGRGTSPTGPSRAGGYRGTGTGTAPSGRTGRHLAAPASPRPATAQPTSARPRSAQHASAQLGAAAAVARSAAGDAIARSAAGDAATVVWLVGSGVPPLAATLPVLDPVTEHAVDVVRPLVDNPLGGPLIDTVRGVLGTVLGSSAGTCRPPIPVPPLSVPPLSVPPLIVPSLIVPTTSPHGSGAAAPTTDAGAAGTIPATTGTVRLVLRSTTDSAATSLAERHPPPPDAAPPRRDPTPASPGRNCPLAPPIPAYGAGTDPRTAPAVSPVNGPLDQLTLACPVHAQRPAAPLDAAYAPATRPG